MKVGFRRGGSAPRIRFLTRLSCLHDSNNGISLMQDRGHILERFASEVGCHVVFSWSLRELLDAYRQTAYPKNQVPQQTPSTSRLFYNPSTMLLHEKVFASYQNHHWNQVWSSEPRYTLHSVLRPLRHYLLTSNTSAVIFPIRLPSSPFQPSSPRPDTNRCLRHGSPNSSQAGCLSYIQTAHKAPLAQAPTAHKEHFSPRRH